VPGNDLLKLNMLLLAYLNVGKDKEAYDTAVAAVTFIKANKLPLKDKSFRYLLATAAEKGNDIALMEEMLRPIIQAEPDDVETLNFLGYVLACRNMKLDEAESLLKKALGLKPESAEITDSYAWVLYRRKDYAKAKKMILKAIRLYEKKNKKVDPVLLDHAAEIFLACGDKDGACRYWETALKNFDDKTTEITQDEIRSKLRKAKSGK